MKTAKPKSKGKNKTNARFGRVKLGNNKESVESIAGPDLSQLRKPIDISVSSLLEVTKLLEIGGDEVKTMLAYECDVVYECRVCRSLFRSLANFISHKRVYCKDKFNIALCRRNSIDYIIPAEPYAPDREQVENGDSKEDDNNIRILRSQVVKRSSKKDLTSIVHMLQRKRVEDINENLLEHSFPSQNSNSKSKKDSDVRIETGESSQEIILETIDSTKTAVYQTATTAQVQNTDRMKMQITELQDMADRDTAILNSDGYSMDANQLEKSDSPLQSYSSEDEDEDINANADIIRDLVCSVCNAKFATRKTLTYHMKSLHVSYRICYPCPCCTSTFANTWSVYRHLFKLHRKTNEQVRKLRTQIQEKAFRKKITGEYIENEDNSIKSYGSLNLQSGNDTQEWMEHFELDLELQRCGGCGRRFDRRAALMSHSQLCQKRIAARNGAAANKAKRLSKTPSPKNLVEDSNSPRKETTDHVVSTKAQSSKKKTPQKNDIKVIESLPDTVTDVLEKTIPEAIGNTELSIRVENVSRITDADWEMMGSNSNKSPVKEILCPISDVSIAKQQTSPARDEQSHLVNTPDSPDVIITHIDKSRTVAISFGAKKRRVSLINNSTREPTNCSVSDENDDSIQMRESDEKEMFRMSPMTIMENRIAMIANLRKLQCLPCRRKFTSMANLRRHMAVHIGWHRYKCKLCDYKCFVKCDCVAHCNKFHDARNNRSIIADMIIPIPLDQSILAQEIMMDIANSNTANSEPEIIDVTESLPKSIESNNYNGVEPKEETCNKEKEAATSDDEKTDQQVTEAETDSEEKSKPTKEEESPKKTEEKENLDERQGKLDKDSDLRKMVMEVIFGTERSDVGNGREFADIRQTCMSEVKISETAELPVRKRDNEQEPAAINDNSPNRNGLSSTASKLEEVIKPQRPTRNRVKPVNQDFIYDLTELIRKESVNHRAAAVAAQKTLKKRQLIQQQAMAENEGNSDSKSDDSFEENRLSSPRKLPNILVQSKRGEPNGYHSKMSGLKQLEVKLINSSINISGKTKISVSSQK